MSRLPAGLLPVAIVTGDLHISDSAPVGWDASLHRIGSLYDQQQQLLLAIKEVQQGCNARLKGMLTPKYAASNVPVIVAGDIYHKSAFKHQRFRVMVEQESLRAGQWMTIFGNHDVSGSATMSSDENYCQSVLNGAFQAMVPIDTSLSAPQAPLYRYSETSASMYSLMLDNELMSGPEKLRIDFQFSNWCPGDAIGYLDKVPEPYGNDDCPAIALFGIGHGYVRCPEEKAISSNGTSARELLSKDFRDGGMSRFDYLLFGDNHQHFTFTRGKQQFVSLGTPNPRRINEMTMKPAVTLICIDHDFDAPTIHLVRVGLSYEVQWADSKIISVLRSNETAIDSMTDLIRGMSRRSAGLANENVVQFLEHWVSDESRKVPESVKSEMLRLLKQAHETADTEESMLS